MNKVIKAFVCGIFVSVIIFLCSCENKVVSGLNTPVTHENISISLIDLFGDEDTTYIVAEVKLSENDSVYDGKIYNSETIIRGNITGGYTTNCIGYDEDKKIQIYLVCIRSSMKRKVDIDFMNYRSTSNLMHLIVEAVWTFSVDLRDQNALIETIDVNDNMISQFKIFEKGIIIVPAQEYIIDDLSNCKIELKDEFDSTVELLANSLSIDKCYLSYGCLLFKTPLNNSDIYKLTIDEKEYLLKLNRR